MAACAQQASHAGAAEPGESARPENFIPEMEKSDFCFQSFGKLRRCSWHEAFEIKEILLTASSVRFWWATMKTLGSWPDLSSGTPTTATSNT